MRKSVNCTELSTTSTSAAAPHAALVHPLVQLLSMQLILPRAAAVVNRRRRCRRGGGCSCGGGLAATVGISVLARSETHRFAVVVVAPRSVSTTNSTGEDPARELADVVPRGQVGEDGLGGGEMLPGVAAAADGDGPAGLAPCALAANGVAA